MTCSRFLLNVCFVIGNLSRWFVMMCWSAASLHLDLFNLSSSAYNLMQTQSYPFVGFVTCISRSREHNCPSYVLLGRKITLSISLYSWRYSRVSLNIFTKIFESNNSLEARIGKQMCMVTRSGKTKNVYPSLQIVRPTSQQTPLPKFVIWFMTC